MININRQEECCGCGACQQSCPSKCIKMEADIEGFLYPVINKNNCVDCNLCNAVCPVVNANKKKDFFSIEPIAFAVRAKDENIRKDSSSGGAFSIIAEYALASSGKVYGCTLDEFMCARHVGVDSRDDLHKLRGSKYIQSRIDNIYNEIREDLKAGKKVVFVGTPCQAAGLHSFLGKEHSNLVIVDFICHGVPSAKIFNEFIKSEEKKAGSKIIHHSFRNKDKGWNQSGLQLGSLSEFADGSKIRRYPAFKDSYMNGFLDDSYLRPICYECQFKNIPKGYSDITIADFWGIKRVAPHFDDKGGSSLVILNTKAAKNVWEKVKEKADYINVDYAMAISRNKPLTESAKRNSRRDKFFEDFEKKGYKYVEKKYMSAIKWAWHKGLSILKRFEKPLKFAIVGASNTIISLITYYVLLFMGVHYAIAYTVGFVASVCNAFFWNSKFVFKDKEEKSTVKAFLKVFASYGFSFLLSIALVSIMVEVIKIPEIIAPILKLIVTIPINYVLNKIWAFKDKK